MAISLAVKLFLGFKPDTDDDIVREEWKKRTKNVCKPCWELKYCPYGPLVEDFPLIPPTKVEAIDHNEFLKEQPVKGVYDKARKKVFDEMARNFTPDDYPEQLSKEELDMSCNVFRHICPVYFVNETFTETEQLRRVGRHIPPKMKTRVARRDNYTCRVCGKHLRDEEIEFHHNIPFS